MKHKLELLSPAKDLSCGKAAIDCGADAVYIGPERFGARKAAGNAIADIAALAAYAHQYRAKVYATLNTILTDEELPEAKALAKELYNAGVDALIVQDPGLCGPDMPPLPLIASTQMHNDTPERVLFLQKAGFKRAILARELTAAEIKKIRDTAKDIELEFFIHGALCVCYSGRCFLSWSMGGRSANRGECAQPCRKLYRIEDAAGKPVGRPMHALCLKDLNLSAHLETLLDAGITSLKIEGRLKDEEYIRTTVLHYRKTLDEIIARRGLEKASSGIVTTDFKPDTTKVFNRGFTSYFLNGPDRDMASHFTPKNAGETLGRARRVRGLTFKLDCGTELVPGDGITFILPDGTLSGAYVTGAEGKRYTLDHPPAPPEGAEVSRNLDSAYKRALKQADISRKIQLTMEFEASDGKLKLAITDEDGTVSATDSACVFETPKNREQAEKAVAAHLSKLGGTLFTAAKVTIKGEAPFAPPSALNELRRKAIQAHLAAREAAFKREEAAPVMPPAGGLDGVIAANENCANRRAEDFYRKAGIKDIEKWAEKGGPKDTAFPLMTCRYCVRRSLGLCKPGANIPLFLLDEHKKKLRLEFDCKHCRMKVFSA